FFFQAEDGIRDRNVTGVQTCALPILPRPRRSDRAAWGAGARRHRREARTAPRGRPEGRLSRAGGRCAPPGAQPPARSPPGRLGRSEERRVGKEWGWWGRAAECAEKRM